MLHQVLKRHLFHGFIQLETVIVFSNEMFGQWNDVFLPLPERRNFYGKYIQAVKQIFPEPALFDHLFEGTVRGCNDSHVDPNRLCSSDPVYLLFLNGSQNFGLKLGLEFPDFIKEKGAVMGQLKKALFSLDAGTRKSALFIAEQFRFQKAGRDRTAVDLNQGYWFRSLALWTISTIISLPTPDSPVIRVVQSYFATFTAEAKTLCMGLDTNT